MIITNTVISVTAHCRHHRYCRGPTVAATVALAPLTIHQARPAPPSPPSRRYRCCLCLLPPPSSLPPLSHLRRCCLAAAAIAVVLAPPPNFEANSQEEQQATEFIRGWFPGRYGAVCRVYMKGKPPEIVVFWLSDPCGVLNGIDTWG